MKTNIGRRNFLKFAGAGTCGTAIHSLLTPTQNMMALAQAGSGNKVMIVVNLSGGCSYNITPIYQGAYRDKNPTISYGPEDSLLLTNDQGLHPSLTALKSVWDESCLGIYNLVGYPDPNRSHDESTDIKFRGTRAMNSIIGGWGARLTCQMDSIFGGVSLGGSNLLITGDCNPPRSFATLNQDAFGERSLHDAEENTSQFLRITRDNIIADSNPGSENLAYVRGQIENLASSIDTVRRATNRNLPSIAPIQFPNSGFGNACRDAARLLNAPELGTQWIFLQDGGYDTHASERSNLTNLLTNVNGGLNALIATAKALGRWQDVVIVTMTEFCRTFENGSQGTDHGHAGPVIVAGGNVRGGINSPIPSPQETASQNYYHNFAIDFRGIFHEVIRYHLGYDPVSVFPEAFQYTQLGVMK